MVLTRKEERGMADEYVPKLGDRVMYRLLEGRPAFAGIISDVFEDGRINVTVFARPQEGAPNGALFVHRPSRFEGEGELPQGHWMPYERYFEQHGTSGEPA